MIHFRKLIIASLAFVVVGTVAGCATVESTKETPAGSSDASPHAQHSTAPGKDVNEAETGYRVQLATQPAEVKAGEPVTFSFSVKDANGAAVRDLQVVHEKQMHLLVVSDDLAEFQHLHPESHADGTFKATHNFTNGGAYRLYTDYAPTGARQTVNRHEISVTGNLRRARAALVADDELTKTVDGLRVTMRPDKTLRAGEELMLKFSAADAGSGKPATDLQPYLGALAHFVIISEDTTDFLHAHPMTKAEMDKAGGAHAATGHDAHAHQTAELKDAANENGGASEVAAHTTFPRPGLYKIWAQFQRGGRVITVPFVVRIEASQTASATAAVIMPLSKR